MIYILVFVFWMWPGIIGGYVLNRRDEEHYNVKYNLKQFCTGLVFGALIGPVTFFIYNDMYGRK